MREEVGGEGDLTGDELGRALGEGDASQGHPEEVEAADGHLAFEEVAGVLGCGPGEAFDEEKVEAEADRGEQN